VEWPFAVPSVYELPACTEDRRRKAVLKPQTLVTTVRIALLYRVKVFGSIQGE
jgi:hypothetical protein